ncbi:MAG: hypothetical protein L3J18_04640 [Candidatus Brocadia sp.]|nr:MAG: hypothetical protein L3J18_04640 [Candidatus Brocadia sp.]
MSENFGREDLIDRNSSISRGEEKGEERKERRGEERRGEERCLILMNETPW